jgi:hypothetical protein
MPWRCIGGGLPPAPRGSVIDRFCEKTSPKLLSAWLRMPCEIEVDLRVVLLRVAADVPRVVDEDRLGSEADLAGHLAAPSPIADDPDRLLHAGGEHRRRAPPHVSSTLTKRAQSCLRDRRILTDVVAEQMLQWKEGIVTEDHLHSGVAGRAIVESYERLASQMETL